MPSDASENLIYSGGQVVSALTGKERVGTIRCLSDNPQALSAAVAQAKKIAGSKYVVTDDSARLSGVLQSVETVRDLVRMVLLSVCLADVLVLGMALVFWIRSRIHEIGTLLALGIGKMRIVAQLAIETGLMAVVAALCSLGTGAMLSGYVSSLLLRDSGVAPLNRCTWRPCRQNRRCSSCCSDARSSPSRLPCHAPQCWPNPRNPFFPLCVRRY